ncbi:MAG: condensation domain-containing protein [Cyanobacteria bacterium J06607_10]
MNPIRRLSPVEEGFEAFNQIASSLNVVTISRIKGFMSQEALEQALRIAEQRHPQLQCCIRGVPGMFRFSKRAKKYLPFQVIKADDDDIWQQVALNELNQSLNSSQYLWRIVLICHAEHNVCHLITTTHHAISDGISTISLHSEILDHCGKIQSGNVLPSHTSTLPFLPSPESMFPQRHQGYRGKVLGLLWVVRTAFKQLYLRPKTLSFEALVPVKERTCNVIYKHIDSELSRALLERCRIEKTTVQGALCAAMLLAVANNLKKTGMKNPSLGCRSFVDLRRRLSPIVGNEHLGSLASGVATFHTITESTDFWQLARDVKQAIRQSLARGEMFSIMTLFKELFNDLLIDPDNSPLTNKAPLAVEVSNIGEIDIPVKYGPLELEEIRFMPAQGIFGGEFFATVATFRRRMTFNFVFSEPSISRVTVEGLIEDTFSYLEGATRSGCS